MFRKILLITVLGALVGIASLGIAQETEKRNSKESQIEKLQNYKDQLSSRLEELKKNIDKKPNGQEMAEKMEKELAKLDQRLERLETAGAVDIVGVGSTAVKKTDSSQYKDMYEFMKQINGKRSEILKSPNIKNKKKVSEKLKEIQTELRDLMRNHTIPDAEKKGKFEVLKQEFEKLGKPDDNLLGEFLPE